MGILFSQNKIWGVSNWIAMGFFRDSLPHLDKTPDLQKKIQFCVTAEMETLDLRDEGIAGVKLLQTLVEQVIENNKQTQGSNFHSPQYFPVYMEKLNELQHLVQDILATSQTNEKNSIENRSELKSDNG